jgi:hypothetical protein
MGRGVVECENGVTYRDISIPKGIKRYDPVLVCIDLVRGTVANVRPDEPDEVIGDAECIHEDTPLFSCDEVPDCEIIETDGSGLS